MWLSKYHKKYGSRGCNRREKSILLLNQLAKITLSQRERECLYGYEIVEDNIRLNRATKFLSLGEGGTKRQR